MPSLNRDLSSHPETESILDPRLAPNPAPTLRAEPRNSSGKSSKRNGRSRASTVRRVPRQERSRILVDCIRIAASEILEKDGPGALTTNNIAARAGVSIGSLYQYFANKEEILEEVFRAQADRSFESSREWATWVKTLPLRDVIRLLVERAVRRHREFHSFHPEFYQQHHEELHVGLRLRPSEEENEEDREPYAVAWLNQVFDEKKDELRVPNPRLASVALAYGMSATLHGLVENNLSLLYDDSLADDLTQMVCGYLLRDETEAQASVTRCTG
jgi:AcrR family transcriptional regulator